MVREIELILDVIREKSKITPRLNVDMHKFLRKKWKKALDKGDVCMIPDGDRISIFVRNDGDLMENFLNDLKSVQTKAIFKVIRPFVKVSLKIDGEVKKW